MRVDLFDLIDGLFQGIVFFFYNLAYTAYLLIRYPTLAPLALFRVARRQKTKQVASLTLLSVTFFAIYWLALQQDGSSVVAELSSFVAAPPSVTAGRWWPAFLGALATATLIDLMLRIWLRMRMPERRYRRDVVRSTVEYALFRPMFIFFAGLSTALAFSGVASDAIAAAVVVAVFLLVLWSFRGPAVVLAAGERRLGKDDLARPPPGRSDPRRKPPEGAVFARHVPLMMVTFLGLVAGVAAARIPESRSGSPTRPELRLDHFSCRMEGQAIRVDAVLFNESRRVAVVDPADLTFAVHRRGGGGDGAVEILRLRADAGAPPLFLVQPGFGTHLRALTGEGEHAPLASGDRCELTGPSGKFEWLGPLPDEEPEVAATVAPPLAAARRGQGQGRRPRGPGGRPACPVTDEEKG